MAVSYNGYYEKVSDIKGPSGWYWLKSPLGPIQVYVNQEYDGGGWVMVMANCGGTGGMNNLTYNDAINNCNFRSSNSVVPMGSKLGSLANYNIFIGTKFWSYLSGRHTTGKTMVVQFVAGTNGTPLNGSHNKRYRWRYDNFNSSFGFVGATGISDETGTGSPGFYSYHAANSYSLTTYDKDLDRNGGNCSSYYNNNPWWYGSCWSGNYFAGGGYQDRPYWTGSSGDHHQYGAVYIK